MGGEAESEPALYGQATILAKLNAEPMRAFLDSGAGVNQMTWAVAQRHGITKLGPVTISLKSITGHHMESMGEVDVSISVEDHRGESRTVTSPFSVVRNAEEDLVLGYPWHAQMEPVCRWNARFWKYPNSKAVFEVISPESFYLEIKDKKRCYIANYKPTTNALDVQEMGLGRSAVVGAIRADTLEGDDEEPDEEPPPAQRLPDYLHDFADVFDNDNASLLPSNGKMDHAIETVDDKDPPYGPLYNLSTPELAVLRDYIDESLQKGWIRRSTSPCGAPILFVPKKDGGLRLCVDYRGLNKITIKNRTALPLISETLDRLVGAAIFTKFDLKDAYHRIRIQEGHEWKTAFRTRYGHFEYLVMPFGLANAPATFQSYINQALIGLVDTICVIYLDDILIYSKTVKEHHASVRKVLERLRQYKLYCNLKKCEFDTDEVGFLGFRISPKGVKMEQNRVTSITEWPEPKTFRDLQVFLGFANFYRRFIKHYSKVVAPMTSMLKGMQEGKKSGPFDFGEAQRKSFNALKQAFTGADVLVHFDPSKPIMLETDASGFAIGAVLSQQHVDINNPANQHWKPVAYFSRKMIPAENNYETHDQELLAIVAAFKHWRHYLEGSAHTVLVKTDHNSLKYFMTKKELNRRQARWAERLSAFDFEIVYRSGKLNPADGPSRRPDYELPQEASSALLPTLQQKLRAVYMTKIHSYKGQPAQRQRRVFAAYMEREQPLLEQPLRKVVYWETGTAPSESQRGTATPIPEEPYTPTAQEHQWSHEAAKPLRTVALLGKLKHQKDEVDDLVGYDSEDAESNHEGDDEKVSDPMPRVLIPRALICAATTGMNAYTVPTTSLTDLIRSAQEAHGWNKDPPLPASIAAKSQDELWMREDKIMVPPVEALRQEIISVCHDDPHSSHFGHLKTTELVRRHYWWEGLGEDVKRYVKTCTTCQRTKVSRHKPYGELASLRQPTGPWQEISMDFVTDLPPSSDWNGTVFDSILVIIDRYTKMALYIAAKKTITSEELAQVFVNRVVRSYGVPKGIVSDRGSVFTSKFWSALCYTLGVKRRLSTAFHPQTDGQTERQNQTLEHYLRCYCNYRQNNWVNQLALAEFTYNNSQHSTIGATPFYALYGFNPEICIHPVTASATTAEVPEAALRVQRLQEEREELSQRWAKAVASQAKYYNQKHTPKRFKIGDRVMLLAKNIRQLRPSKKLADRYLGPFEVEKVVGDHGQAYKLNLPEAYRIHPVFHVSLLEPYHERSDAVAIEPADIDIDGEESWEVEAILAHRDRKRPARREYLVRWRGFAPSSDSWEPKDNFNTTEVIEEYEEAIQKDGAPPEGGRKRKTQPSKQRKNKKARLRE